MRALLLFALLALAPLPAAAHGDGQHAGEGGDKVTVASHPCPAGSGECCCARSVTAAAKPPAAAAAPWTLVHRPAAPAPAAAVRAAFPSTSYLPANPRAPPAFS